MTDSDDQHTWQSICIRYSGHWPNLSTVLVCTDGDRKACIEVVTDSYSERSVIADDGTESRAFVVHRGGLLGDKAIIVSAHEFVYDRSCAHGYHDDRREYDEPERDDDDEERDE